MLTANLYCEPLEFLISVDADCARLLHKGDVTKVSFLLPGDAKYYRRLEKLADGEVVTLYRNTVWIKLEVKRREFFILDHSTRELQNATLYVEPLTRNALDALKVVIEVKREEAKQKYATA